MNVPPGRGSPGLSNVPRFPKPGVVQNIALYAAPAHRISAYQVFAFPIRPTSLSRKLQCSVSQTVNQNVICGSNTFSFVLNNYDSSRLTGCETSNTSLSVYLFIPFDHLTIFLVHQKRLLVLNQRSCSQMRLTTPVESTTDDPHLRVWTGLFRVYIH